MSATSQSTVAVSVVIPVFNEEANLPVLFNRLYPVLDGLGRTYEVIFTNDLPDAVRMLQAPSELERAVSESLTASTFITTLFEADRWPVRARMGYVMNPLLP